MADVFRKGKYELIALIETKMKGNAEISWCEVSFIGGGPRGNGGTIELCDS